MLKKHIILDHLITGFLITEKHGDVLVLTPVRRGQWASRGSEATEVESRKTVSCCESNTSRFFERSRLHLQIKQSWGCTGFDAVIGKSGLRVRALFSVINEQIKTNAESNVVYANFGRESRLAA